MENSELITGIKSSVRVGSAETGEAVKRMSAVINRAFVQKGQIPSADTVTLTAMEVVNRLRKKIPAITFFEIQEACERGVYGEYGEYFGINAVSICGWCEAFFYSEERVFAIRLENTLRDKADTARQITGPTADDYLRDRARRYFDEIKSTGRFKTKLCTPKARCYDWLVNRRILLVPSGEVDAMIRRLSDNNKSRGLFESAVEEPDIRMRAKANLLYQHLKAMESCPV